MNSIIKVPSMNISNKRFLINNIKVSDIENNVYKGEIAEGDISFVGSCIRNNIIQYFIHNQNNKKISKSDKQIKIIINNIFDSIFEYSDICLKLKQNCWFENIFLNPKSENKEFIISENYKIIIYFEYVEISTKQLYDIAYNVESHYKESIINNLKKIIEVLDDNKKVNDLDELSKYLGNLNLENYIDTLNNESYKKYKEVKNYIHNGEE